jgi:glutathione synthase/RimK-type ligase-like ATP-grasp enzyme
MNKLVVVTKNKDTYFIKRLTEEVRDSALFFNPWQDFVLPESEKYLVRTTGVYGSDLDLHFLSTLPSHSIINPLSSLKLFRSKLTQYQWLEDKGFKSPEWINLKDGDDLEAEKFFRLFPFAIVKPQIGQGGWGIEGLDWPNFKTWWKNRKGRDEDYLLQRFLPNVRELRLFFIRDHFSLVLERKSKSSIAANFKKQGSAVPSKIPEEFQLKVGQLLMATGLDYGAIDFLIDGDQIYVIDINCVPGIEQLEAISGENIMRKLLTANFFSQLI